MKHALDTNGKQIVTGRLALYDGRLVFILRMVQHKEESVVLIKPYEEDHLRPLGLRWLYHTDKELTLISEQETTFLLLKHKVNE